MPKDILQSVFGFPSECTHNNIIRTCTLSFTCWIQGGRHAEGCGDNKWLFSCCISETEFVMNFEANGGYNKLIKSNYFGDDSLPPPSTRYTTKSKIKSKSKYMISPPPSPYYKPNTLRRRMDEMDMMVF